MYMVDGSNVLKQFAYTKVKNFVSHNFQQSYYWMLEWAPKTLCMTIGKCSVQPLIIYLFSCYRKILDRSWQDSCT